MNGQNNIFLWQDGFPQIPDEALETVENLGAIEFPVLVRAIITLVIVFFVIIVFFEWRRMNSETAIRDELRKQAKDSQRGLDDTEKELDKERDTRRKVEDELAEIRRNLRDVQSVQNHYDAFVKRVIELKENGDSLDKLDVTIPLPDAAFFQNEAPPENETPPD